MNFFKASLIFFEMYSKGLFFSKIRTRTVTIYHFNHTILGKLSRIECRSIPMCNSAFFKKENGEISNRLIFDDKDFPVVILTNMKGERISL